VDLYEKSDMIGGRIVAGSQAAIKFDVGNYRKYLERQVKEARDEFGMCFYPQTEIDALGLKGKGYDAIVFAVGTKDAVPPISGIEQAKNVVQAATLFKQPELLGAARKVVIVGGGAVGCELAQWLAYEQGREVTVVEMLPNFMEGACTANRTHLLHALKAKGVTLLNMTMVTDIDGDMLTIRRNYHKNVPNPYNTWNPLLPENISNPMAPKIGDEWKAEALKADLVVLAAGGRPDDSLYYAAQKERSAKELYNIGDSFAPGRILEAVRGAYRLGVSI
jgi:2-enoate reductase